MAIIQSGATTDVLTVDPSSKAARATLYDTAGNEITSSHPLNVVVPGGVTVSNHINVEPGTTPLTVVDGGGSVTVDGIVAISNFPTSSPAPGSSDVFGAMVTSHRKNQIEVSFDGTPPLSGYLTVDTTGTGTNSIGSGLATISTGTGGTALSSATSTTSVRYRPGFEIYSYFTATFTNPTDANSFQRIGLFDANNGFYVGYEGTTWGISHRSGTFDTHIARGSFNGDLLDGGVNSKFTRVGSPEAIDLTKLNVFRIRFGWLGAAPILYEVLSPDGAWVVFHTVIQPNTSATPSIQTPNLSMMAIVSKTGSDGTNLTIGTACWGAGTSSDGSRAIDNFDDNSLVINGRNVIVGASTANDGTYVNMKMDPSGVIPLPFGAATEASLGTDGATPPSITGTGIRGWLRAIYEKVAGTLTVGGTVAVTSSAPSPLYAAPVVAGGAVSSGNPLPVGGTVTVTQGTPGASNWLVSATQNGTWGVTANAGTGDFNVVGAVTANAGTGTFNTTLASGPGTAANTPIYASVTGNVDIQAATNSVSAVGAAAAAVTATLPAAGTGLFHYITAIEITMYSTAARTGGATPVTVTTTNFNSAVVWKFPSAGAVGTISQLVEVMDSPIRSSVNNTNTTIVCPATTSVIWNVTVYYYTAP